MTAHELARKLLEGPDVLVAYVNQTYDESEVCEVTQLSQATLWRARLVGEHWSDWSEESPRGFEGVDKQSMQAVKLT